MSDDKISPTTDPLDDLKTLSLGRTMAGPNFYDVAPLLITEIEQLRAVLCAARCIRHWHDSLGDEGMVVSKAKVFELWEAIEAYDQAKVSET